jgi:hypothetical protein
MELISPSFENKMLEELKPRRRTLSETNDIFPEKKTTPKKFPNSPKSNSTFSYNDFSYKVRRKQFSTSRLFMDILMEFYVSVSLLYQKESSQVPWTNKSKFGIFKLLNLYYPLIHTKDGLNAF